MIFDKAYRSYEEFEREELRPFEKVDVRVDDLLGEFDLERRQTRREMRREGLFDLYDEESEEDEYE